MIYAPIDNARKQKKDEFYEIIQTEIDYATMWVT